MINQDKDNLIAALQAEIDTMKTIISMMPGHVYWKNSDGRYMGCNNNLAKVLKLSSPDDIIGKTDADLTGVDIADKTTKVDSDVLKNQNELRTEEEGFDADGKPALYLTQKSPLLDRQGQVKGVLGVSLDITARKHTEEKLRIAKRKAEAASRAKSQFLALISHELRTPLTSLLGFVNFLDQETLSEEDKKLYIQHIVNSGSYLFSLINNLLDYNKLETNKYELFSVPFDLKKLMEDVVSMLSGAAKFKNLTLSLEYEDDIPKCVIGDGRILRQILVNLIGNALKFTEKGCVTLTVNCLEQSLNSAKLRIAVKDTGVGIPIHEQNAIFKRFYQSGNVYTRNTSLTGTGLGLAIVKRLAKLIDSKIELESVPNQGSEFYFTVDFQTSDIRIQTQPRKIEVEIKHSQHPRVLLVEDDALIQIVHKQMLQELGCIVEVAECANKAISMLNNDYDLLFVDIGLPDMTGFDLIKMMRQEHLSEREIPIIALTGYSEEEERQQCFYSGADEVAIKPITKAALGKILEHYLK